MSISISEAQARLIYLDYHTRGNTMGTSAQEMGAIVSQYSDKIHTWQASVDSNQYEWDDSDYDQYIEDGREIGMEATGGHTRKDQAGDVAKATGDITAAAGGAVMSLAGGKIIGEVTKGVVADALATSAAKAVGTKVGGKAAEKLVEEGAKKAIEEGTKKGAETLTQKGAEQVGKNISSYIAIAIGVLVAATYWIKKPNKEGAKACEDIKNPLANAQGALQGSQAEMENMKTEMVQLSDEASSQNDNTNAQIADKKTEQDYYMSIYRSIKAKIDAGKKLSDDEKALYKVAAGKINNTGTNINNLVEENQLIISDINESMGTYQEGYDYAAETMGEAQGLVEYSASFDKQTKTLAYVEMISQGLNLASVGIALAKLAATIFMPSTWIAMAAGAGAMASSGIAMKEQADIAKNAGNTIEQREITEDINAATQDVYDVEIDNYAVLMEGTETLEVAVPTDIKTVDASVPKDSGSEDTKPKKVEKEKDK